MELLIDGVHRDDDLAMPVSRILVCFRFWNLILLSLLLVGKIRAQAQSSYFQENDSLVWYIQKEYGLDQELIHGIQFYQRYSHCEGDPYFPSDSFYKGVLHLRGGESHQAQMKYDIYAQQVVVGYTDYSKRYNQVVIDSMRIDSFLIGKYMFKKMGLSNIKPIFYQVFNSGQVSCFAHWSKQMTTTSFKGRYTHKFSEPDGNFFLMYQGQVQPFHSKKTFLSILPEAIQSDVRKYFRQQKIKISIAGTEEFENLIYFIDSKMELQPNN